MVLRLKVGLGCCFVWPKQCFCILNWPSLVGTCVIHLAPTSEWEIHSADSALEMELCPLRNCPSSPGLLQGSHRCPEDCNVLIHRCLPDGALMSVGRAHSYPALSSIRTVLSKGGLCVAHASWRTECVLLENVFKIPRTCFKPFFRNISLWELEVH